MCNDLLEQLINLPSAGQLLNVVRPLRLHFLDIDDLDSLVEWALDYFSLRRRVGLVLCDVILRGTIAHVESFVALKRQLCRVFSFGADFGTPKAGSLVRRGSLRLLSLK